MFASKGFVSQIVPEELRMSCNQYKQLRGAFHPSHKLLGNATEDKSYTMLQRPLNELKNQAHFGTTYKNQSCLLMKEEARCVAHVGVQSNSTSRINLTNT